MDSRLPAWCRVRRGASDVVLIAPHGGRRPPTDPTTPRERKVNDLHTADLTADWATALDATAIINESCDRNELDLNRIGQVQKRASWFLDLLVDEIGTVLARHAQAQVLVVHGWNVAQPKCDLGVGGVEKHGALHPLGDAALSVTPAYWSDRVIRFRAACAAAGIDTPVGERYPAAHRNNLLQLLTPRFATAADARLQQLAAWAASGRLQALQLELGIPLRWPGVLRQALRAAVVDAFGRPGTDVRSWSPRTAHATLPTAVLGFHFHDPKCGVTAFTSITPFGTVTSGRLLLFLGGQAIALFTGEEPGLRDEVGSLTYQANDRGFNLRFAGHASQLADARLYLDLEAALAASVLAEIKLDLQYEPLNEANARESRPGRFSGSLQIDGRHVPIATRGFLDPGVAMRGPGTSASRTHLAATFDDHTAFSLRGAHGEPTLKGTVFVNREVVIHPHGEITLTTDQDDYTPSQFQLRLPTESKPAIVHPLARMPILRPLNDGTHARITFGPARFEWNGRTGWGVYEYARRVTPLAGTL